MGVWLIETYKGTFTSEINKAGIDGLISTLAEKEQTAGSQCRKNPRT
ncbi:ABC transporter substrate-binding protein [Undibacterium arcticum]